MKLIIGLGNPGLTYKNTRHNIGFMFIDSYAKENKLQFKLEKSLFGMICKFKQNDEDVILLKPMTFMNESGKSVKQVMNYYKIDVDDILVIHDDLDLPVGKIRIRANGSSGGQKGINNIMELLGTTAIKRIRIGIDKDSNAINHVLGNFRKDEREVINRVIEMAPKMIDDYLVDTFDNFMNKYNGNGN